MLMVGDICLKDSNVYRGECRLCEMAQVFLDELMNKVASSGSSMGPSKLLVISNKQLAVMTRWFRKKLSNEIDVNFGMSEKNDVKM